jgi:branched-chain amino acid transport system substrate-binding protein
MKKGYPKILLMALCLVVIVAMIPLTGACNSSSSSAKELKVGMILPATGDAAEKGKPGGEAVLDAAEYINTELNGVNGYKFVIDWRDSNYDNAKVGNIVTEFMSIGDVLFTAMSSKEMTAAMEKANRAGFPGLVTFAAPNNYNPPEHIYAHSPDYGDGWVAFTNYYLKNVWKGSGKPKMALLILNNTTGSSVRDVANAKAASMGVEIIDVVEHTAVTISEMASLTSIKAKNPDVLYIASTPKPTSVILKNANDLGLKVTIGMGHAALAQSLIDLAGADIVEGVYGTYPTVTWDDNAPGIAKAKEYIQKKNREYKNNMDYLSTWTTTLIVAEILKNAVKNAGYNTLAKGDAAAWKAIEEQGIRKLNGYQVEGLQGPVSYVSGSNKLGKYMKLHTVKSGKITPIGDWIEAK